MTTPTPDDDTLEIGETYQLPMTLNEIDGMTVMYQEEFELRMQKEKELAAALDLQAAYFDRCEQLLDALAAAQERIRELEDAKARIEAEMHTSRSTKRYQQMRRRAQAAEARAEAAEKDAGRYRWLRVQPHADIAACWYMPVLPQDYPVDTPEQRDAAIDAAVADGEKP